MHNEVEFGFRNCRDLQSLINITLNDVIRPLRQALRNNTKSKIIALEIQDAENKVYEYIASQITTIGNACELESSKCLKEYPKSDICYRCIGLDDDTIEGFLKIRDISFLNFLELEQSDIECLLKKYSVNDECILSILKAVNVIKQNIDLMYSNSSLFDNTRDLIKLVTRLVDNRSTDADLSIVGIPFSSNESNSSLLVNDIHTSCELTNQQSLCDYCVNNDSNNNNPQNCLSLSTDCAEHRKCVSHRHPSSITSTRRPVNQEMLIRALSGIVSNDERSFLRTKQNPDINSLSVPNTPNAQKSRSVGGSEEVLNDLKHTLPNEHYSDLNTSPVFFRKNYTQTDSCQTKRLRNNKNVQLQRSLSHEFDSKNMLNLKNPYSTNSNNCTNNQTVQTSVFQFNTDNNNQILVAKERRSSYEEKLLYKSCTMACDLNSLGRMNSPVNFGRKQLNESTPKVTSNHKFEPESKFGIPNLMKPPMCVVCKTKKFLPKLLCCEFCKIKVHKNCLCGASQIPCINSPTLDRKSSDNSVANASTTFQGSDSNSTSSCNSSAPASPFYPESGYNSSVNNHISPRNPNKRLVAHKFEFCVIDETDTAKHMKITDSEKSEECDNVKGIHFESSKLSQRYESTESADEFSRLSRTNSISVALKEWEIPLENLELGELLGKGSFSTVYKGKWHGEVAVKIMNIDPQDEADSCMAAFKSEVGALHKTRHENLVLFMGACMKPPKLAIVTQLSQGETLFHQLHLKHMNLPIIRSINIAGQVAKGMGYLHAKDILHKDLKSRNIFIENNCKVVISDFGLFDFVRMCKQARSGSYLKIPPGWLCYLAPELIKKLNLNSIFSNNANEDLPFTKASDIYAFGTIWYEILNNKWPFEGLPSEAIIYRVGKGIKESLKTIHAKEFKDLLIQCWSSNPSNRPAFTNIVHMLEKLPKLQRSPSYPVKSVTVGKSHETLIT